MSSVIFGDHENSLSVRVLSLTSVHSLSLCNLSCFHLAGYRKLSYRSSRGTMSPILKRDVHEQLRQAKRLAQSITGTSPSYHDGEYDFERGHGDSYASPSTAGPSRPATGIGIGVGAGNTNTKHEGNRRSVEIYTSSSHPRRGIGVRDVEVQDEGGWRGSMVAEEEGDGRAESSEMGRRRVSGEVYAKEDNGWEGSEAGDGEAAAFLPQGTTGTVHTTYPPRTPALPHLVSPGAGPSTSGRPAREEATGPSSALADLRNLLVEVS